RVVDLACQELYGGVAGEGAIIGQECTGEGDRDLYLIGLRANGVSGTGVNAIGGCAYAGFIACDVFLELLAELKLQAGQERILYSIQIGLCYGMDGLWIDTAGEGGIVFDKDAVAAAWSIESVGGNIACGTCCDGDDGNIERVVLRARRYLCILDGLELEAAAGRECCLCGDKDRI